MKLSIIILSYNGCNLTLRCLDSLSQTLADHKDYKVVIIDNGSTDADLKGEIDKKKYSWGERLQLIRLEANKGVAGGRNIGMQASCDAQYMLLLDNDTIASEEAIRTLVEFMDENKDVGLVAPCLISPEGKIQISYKPFPGIKEKLLNFFGRSNELEACSDKSIRHPFYVIGACQLIRASVASEIGTLDESIFFGPEDADYCMRVRRAAKEVAYLPFVEIIHDWQRSSRKSLFSPISRAHLKGLFYFYRKWRRFW